MEPGCIIVETRPSPCPEGEPLVTVYAQNEDGSRGEVITRADVWDGERTVYFLWLRESGDD
jgi:hypothetical protein